jgi:hypothetical protein
MLTPFERKVLDFAQRLSQQLTGRGHQRFVMVFDAQGAVQTLYFECPDESWHQFTNKLEQADTPHLFYDPFDAPEYTWLSWAHIDRSVMERLIGDPFEDADFVKYKHGAWRAPDLQPVNRFPVSWGVMF